MNEAAALAEPSPFLAALADATQTARRPSFRAAPPAASPLETMKLDRNARMDELLSEAIANTSVAPKLSALGNFQRLLAVLPEPVPASDPYVSDSGNICIDWDFDRDCQLSIILKDNSQIAYAAYFSGERVHGSADFTSAGLPEGLAIAAKRWIRTVHAARRT